MPPTCTRCSRANPAEALYCYFDGASLEGSGTRARPAAVAAFPSPFVFPSGRSCRTFDELAQACLGDWPGARDLLREGLLERFLGGLGRADLALAARTAAAFPDPDRGLDQLLAQLPTRTVQAPVLHASPGEVSLGTLQVGAGQRLDLQLSNRGQRLLFGSVVSDCTWLTLGEGPGSPQKLFQLRDEAIIPVQVRGEHLRAGPRPLTGRLIVESNGGTCAVRVQAEVPVQPFPEGVLAGALSPRQLAEKARAAPREAARLFETGAVAKWYERNGWTYPVPGPAASGVAAVQQFFEALGLTRPPRVEISEQALTLRGAPGERLHRTLQVRSPEKRPVFAHARTDQPWLSVGQVQHAGPAALIPLEVAAAPGQAGQVLQARVLVTANGNQRFVVPVTLTVAAVAIIPAAAVPVAVRPAALARPARRRPPVQAPARRTPLWVHAIPAAVLLLLLLGLSMKDVFTDAPRQVAVAVGDEPPEEKKAPGPAPLAIQIQDEPEEHLGDPKAVPVRYEVVDEPEIRDPVLLPVKVQIQDEPQEGGGGGPAAAIDEQPRVRFLYGGRGRFGLSVAQTGKLLTYSPNGATNTTVVSVDGQTMELGAGAAERIKSLPPNPLYRGQRLQSTWSAGSVELVQTYELVPSKQPVEVAPGVQKRLVDTLLIRYTITNRDSRPHQAGLRTEVDTLIGNNDGVPFTVPGLPGLVDTFRDFPVPEQVPDFIQALEVPNLQNPGTVAHMTLKLGGGLEPPGRVSLTHWSGGFLPWNVPVVHMTNDSAVILYWNPKPLGPGKKRESGFAYGLGSVSAGETTGRLGVTLGGSFEPGQVFTITAYVTNPAPNQTLTLELPAGLERVEGAPTQPAQVPAGGGRNATAVVSWKAKVQQTGVFPLRVRSSTGVAQTKTITIARPDGPAGGNFALALSGGFEPGQVFNVQARVSQPVAGQTLTLKLPPGLSRVGGAEVEPVPPARDGTSLVGWKIKVDAVGKHPVRVQSSTGVTQTKTVVIARAEGDAGKVAVALAGDFAPGKVFTVTARVSRPLPGQTLTLALGDGLERTLGQETEPVAQPALKDGDTTVTWGVKVGQPGKHTVAVRSSTGVTVRKTLSIDRPDESAGRFTLAFSEGIALGKDFQVLARVTNPVPGQRLTLTLPRGLKLEEGHEIQEVPALSGGAREGTSTVAWRVRVLEMGRLPVRVASTTGVARTKVLTLSGADGPGQIFGR
jgi:hypothetical protein